MKRVVAGAALFAAFALAMPDPGSAFTGRRGTRVNPVNDAVFEVIARTAGSGSDYWCGAGEYASRAVNAAWTARIYIARGRGPSVTTGRKSAVQFTLDPTAAGITPVPPSFSLNALRVGDSMSVQEARSHCPMQPVRP